jgi:hypothetical protein
MYKGIVVNKRRGINQYRITHTSKPVKIESTFYKTKKECKEAMRKRLTELNNPEGYKARHLIEVGSFNKGL